MVHLLSLSHELLNFIIELAAELEPRERDEPGCDVLPRWNQRFPGESDLERDQRLSIPPSVLGKAFLIIPYCHEPLLIPRNIHL